VTDPQPRTGAPARPNGHAVRPPHQPIDGAQISDLLAVVADVARASTGREADWQSADLLELARESAAGLRARLGLSARASRRLAAAFELGRRVQCASRPARARLASAEDVFALLGAELRGVERETFHVLLLDGKHALKRCEVVSVGSLTSSIVHPREVFRAAVREAAAAIVCAHNHPSGDPEPSAEDVDVTRRLASAGKLVGIPLLDHVVIGDGRYVSLRERIAW
jgi:DNA repair protein RadC